MRSAPPWLVVAAFAVSCTRSIGSPAVAEAELGGTIFRDTRLSEPPGQACADCHAPTAAFRDPEADHSTSSGAIASRFGARNAPTAMYAAFVPELHYDASEQQLVGGLRWDGAADSLETQAGMPLLEPLEMNNPSKAAVVAKVRNGPYAQTFREVFGATSLDDADIGFAHIAEAITAFERTPALSPFASRYDRYLAGTTPLSASEQRGLAIFEDPARGNCAGCHPSRPGADGSPPLFTTFAFANLGLPTYANSRFFTQPRSLNPAGARYIDHGLMATVGSAEHDGKFRIPTLRNIARTEPYGHNGYFANLPFFIDFLNTRDVGSNVTATCSRADAHATCAWPAPEVPATVDPRVGHLGLGPSEVDDLVAFLGTLSDDVPTSR